MIAPINLLIILCDLFLILRASAPLEHEYRIREEIPVGSHVGNVVEDVLTKLVEYGLIKLPNAVHQVDDLTKLFTFKILNYADPGANCFEIKPDGHLVTTRRIDRELLCSIRHKAPGSTFGLMESINDQLQIQSLSSSSASSSDSTKMDNPNAVFCPITLHCALHATSSDSKSSLPHATNHVTEPSRSEQTARPPPAPPVLLLLRILIEDINDNTPYWPGHLQRFQVQFRDGDPIGERRNLPPATDNDVGNNAQLRYELSSASPSSSSSSSTDNTVPFSLVEHPTDGLYLYATRQIDREEQASYQLQLKAIDCAGTDNGVRLRDSLSDLVNPSSAQLTATLLLDVQIEDINDNAPLFTQPIFSPSHPIPETTPVGKTVLVLNATDADAGLNGAFHFAFSKEHAWLPAEQLAREYFDVRPNGHVVIRRSLNVDRLDGRDRAGSSGRRSETLDMPIRSSNRESGMQFRFRVVVEDEAIRPYTRSSEATVVIVVSDENDEAPIIYVKPRLPQTWAQSNQMGMRIDPSRYHYLVVEENQPPGTKVATIHVYDPDFDGTDHTECRLRTTNFTLSRTSDEVSGGAAIADATSHSVAGLIEYNLLTAIELDREVTGTQTVPILCSDLAGHYTEQNVTVHVTDRNDNAPQFVLGEFTFQVEENAPPNTPLRMISPPAPGISSSSALSAQSQSAHAIDKPVQHRSVPLGLYHWNLLATDLDAGLNAEIQYQLLENGSNSTRFNIDPVSGALTTAVVFDREATDQYVLEALAIDKGSPPLTSSVAVKVMILDVNDNAPQFSRAEYSFHVLENQPRSTQIGQISAVDLDSELHGPIAYFLSTDRDALSFRLDRETGVLRSRQPLDREEQARYVFRVLARDASPSAPGPSSRPVPAGAVQLTGTATVTVIVDDENDNWPVFVSPNATANTLAIAVDETLGHKLAYIQAEDADQDENGLVSYHIRSGNTHHLFGLDSATGLLYLAGNLGQQGPGTGTQESAVSPDGNESASSVSNWSAQLYQPSFHVLTLEACDHGRNPKPHCTLFSNLKIIIKNPKEDEFTEYVRNGQIMSKLDSITSRGASLGTGDAREPTGLHPEAMLYGSDQSGLVSIGAGSGGLGQTRHNASEIVIICLSIVFTVVLLATLLLICLLRRRSLHYFNQKRIVADNNHESRDPDWNKACSSSQLDAEPAAPACKPPAFEADQQRHQVRDSMANSPESDSRKLHDPDLPGYPGPMDMMRDQGAFVGAAMPKDQYHLLTRTVDVRRRNQLREYSLPDPSVELQCTPNSSGDSRFPTLAGPGHMNPRLPNGKLSRASDYQTLDYLGLVSTAIPQRYPHLYATQRRLTYSPIASQPTRTYHGTVFAGIRPHIKTDSILLTHMNRLTETSNHSPPPPPPAPSLPSQTPDFKSSDGTFLVTHSHSRSQPQPLDRRSVVYPLVNTTTFSGSSAPTMAPVRLGIRGFPSPLSMQQQAVYQSVLNNTAVSNGTGGPTTAAPTIAGGAFYGPNPARQPIQSHTYYDIRQPDQPAATHPLPKSKSQQIARSAKLEPMNIEAELDEDEADDEQSARTDPTTNDDTIGTPLSRHHPRGEVQATTSKLNSERPWPQRTLNLTDQIPTDWLQKMPNQGNTNSVANVPRFISSPVDSPRYVAAAYKEASFV